jgi:hypothetical protein
MNGVDIKQLKQEIDELPVEDKVKLVQEVLSSSGLQVVMGGGNFFSAEIVLQIQQGDSDQIAEILKALAFRVSSEVSAVNGNRDHGV